MYTLDELWLSFEYNLKPRVWKSRMAQWIARHLPKRVVYFVVIRVVARSDEDPTTAIAMDLVADMEGTEDY